MNVLVLQYCCVFQGTVESLLVSSAESTRDVMCAVVRTVTATIHQVAAVFYSPTTAETDGKTCSGCRASNKVGSDLIFKPSHVKF